MLFGLVVAVETGVFFCRGVFWFGDVSAIVVSNCVKSELLAVLRIHSFPTAVFWLQLCFGFFFVVLGVTVDFYCCTAVFLDLGLNGSGGQARRLAREQRGQGVRQTWAGTDFGNAAPADFGIFLMNVSSRSALFRFGRLDF